MWILFALLSAFFYALASMVAKYSISKVVRDQRGIVIIHALATILLIGAVWIAIGRPELSNMHDKFYALLSGVLIGFGAVFYFKSYHMEDASIVTLLSQIIVPMTILGGIIFLSDNIGLVQLLASVMILGGVTFATWSRKGFHLHSTKIIPVILCATGITSAVLLISRSVVEHSDTIAFMFYQSIGYVIFGVLFTAIHKKTRVGFMKNIRPLHLKMLFVILGSEVLFTLADLTRLKAYKFVNAGLVSSVGASEVFMSIIIGYALTKLVPHIISEKIDKKTIGRKIVAGVMIVTGIVVLNFVS